jgi:hypothetical protein
MRTSPKTNPVMACDYDDEGLSGSVNPSGSGSGSGVVQEDEEEGERKRKRKTNSGGAKKKDGDDTASLLKRIRASLLRRDIWKLTKKRTWKHKSRRSQYAILGTRTRLLPLLLLLYWIYSHLPPPRLPTVNRPERCAMVQLIQS